MSEEIRLNKYLAENFGLSRREADAAIERGKVLVDGQRAVIGARVKPGAKVTLAGHEVDIQKKIYLMLNKPVNYVCSRKRQGETPTIYELLPEKYATLKSVGRLDKNSSGLILLTNDGDFAFRMTHPSFAKTKNYEVTIDRELEPLHQQMIADFGIRLNDGISKLGLTRLNDENRREWLVTMSEGRNRQIRRTFEALGYRVERLHRIAFGPYTLEGLEPGKYQETEAK